jgi:16S rRNA (cytidine1402-2'-O)-methyltransferase
MMALHEHNEREQSSEIIKKIQSGQKIALISDAGTPLISDPGYHLVAAAHEAQVPVFPIPGASALIAALSASGLPTDRFVFEGFLPSKSVARHDYLQNLVDEPRTLIFYEAPHRLLESLESMLVVFGEQRVAVLAREITKLYETIKQLPLGELTEWVRTHPEQQKGESVIMLAGAAPGPDKQHVELDVDTLLTTLLTKLSVKDAAHMVSHLTGLAKNQLYARALEIQQQRIE